ncbi:MAG: type 2 isopentenyl-diphosphate Delta-isomerase [Bacteroidetes bacterium]|nr:type 2 isopentenyl-diphosphate Delta-isomerase [Bacteroidota bacterium]
MTQSGKSFPPAASDRKDAHLDLAVGQVAQSDQDAGFDRIRLDHCALPECDLASIDISTNFLGRRVLAPLFIGSMTGGTARADTINSVLAEVAEACGVGLGVGSQRASIERAQSQRDLRDRAPSVPLIGNLGGVQLAAAAGLDMARRAVDDLRADAIFIHLHPLQEAVQPEGETDWRGVLGAIEAACSTLPCPVIVKEVGAGISANVARRLFDVGVYGIDIAGLGGTNWTRIEAARCEDAGRFDPFLDWGIPTVDAIRAVREALPEGMLIASGGIRHGLDAAKALWLGASQVSMAGPVLKTVVGADFEAEAAIEAINRYKQQIRLTLFLTGAPNLASFASVPGTIDH